MSQNINFPRRNLPGSAENWGRQVEAEVAINRNNVLSLAQQVNNDGRSNSGQLAVLARQMNDIIEQQNFLANQFTFQSLNYDSRWEVDQSPAVVDLETTHPFDGELDIAFSRTAPPSGSFRVDLTARLYSLATSTSTHWVRSSVNIAPFMTRVGGGEPPESIGVNLSSISTASSGISTVDTYQPVSVFFAVSGLEPGAEYRFFTNRFTRFSAASGTVSGGRQYAGVAGVGMSVTALGGGVLEI